MCVCLRVILGSLGNLSGGSSVILDDFAWKTILLTAPNLSLQCAAKFGSWMCFETYSAFTYDNKEAICA